MTYPNRGAGCDYKQYIAIHKAPPYGIRRWRFMCFKRDTHDLITKLEVDGEFSVILTAVQGYATNEFGECMVEVDATSGPPGEAGKLPETLPDKWQMNQIRDDWTGG